MRCGDYIFDSVFIENGIAESQKRAGITENAAAHCSFSVWEISLRCVTKYGDAVILKATELKIPEDLVERVDFLRIEAFGKATDARRAKLGQFPTPTSVSGLMAACLSFESLTTKLLDAGAGVGSLTAAAIAELGTRKGGGRTVKATAYELDTQLAVRLDESLRLCEQYACGKGIEFDSKVITEDFIAAAVEKLSGSRAGKGSYNCAILNPPYRKLNNDSKYRKLLRSVGIEASNLYTAFLSLTVKLLEANGEMVAIVPRSFCNGPYFKSFRQLLLQEMSIDAVHLFKSRKSTFAEDEVLQESIIFHAVKTKRKPRTVKITSSYGAQEEPSVQLVSPGRMVIPEDPECFIHLVTDETGRHVSELMGKLTSTLSDLGIEVSTGKVVDFRAAGCLRRLPYEGTVPLIYPTHFSEGWVAWPRFNSKKPNAITAGKKSANALIPAGIHVLVKRFSAKEERRRVVAAVFDPGRIDCEKVGFENRVNYFHVDGGGMPLAFAKGLTAYLNSSVVDLYFRQMNGHTQVNALDLRNMRYPDKAKIEKLGRCIGKKFPKQQELDQLVERELLDMGGGSAAAAAMNTRRRVEEAVSIVKAVGVPVEHQNERTGMVFLSLVGLDADKPWSDAKATPRRINQLVNCLARQFCGRYAIRGLQLMGRSALRQLRNAGIVVKAAEKVRQGEKIQSYQVDGKALELFRAYGSPTWDRMLATWLASVKSLRDKKTAERNMQQIAVKFPDGGKVLLKQRSQNVLIKHIIEDFCSRFTPDADVLYVGASGEKPVVFEAETLEKLGVSVGEDSKMPDVVLYFAKKKWLVLVAAVTGNGPVNAKRYRELKELFKGSKVGLVFVTTFLDRTEMKKHINDIAWETEVWVAEAPGHLIHFNGERFLGPYA